MDYVIEILEREIRINEKVIKQTYPLALTKNSIDAREKLNSQIVQLKRALDILKNDASALAIHSVSNSVCSCPDEENQPIKWICTKCGGEWKPLQPFEQTDC